jgi:hypothetical protein
LTITERTICQTSFFQKTGRKNGSIRFRERFFSDAPHAMSDRRIVRNSGQVGVQQADLQSAAVCGQRPKQILVLWRGDILPCPLSLIHSTILHSSARQVAVNNRTYAISRCRHENRNTNRTRCMPGSTLTDAGDGVPRPPDADVQRWCLRITRSHESRNRTSYCVNRVKVEYLSSIRHRLRASSRETRDDKRFQRFDLLKRRCMGNLCR